MGWNVHFSYFEVIARVWMVSIITGKGRTETTNSILQTPSLPITSQNFTEKGFEGKTEEDGGKKLRLRKQR